MTDKKDMSFQSTINTDLAGKFVIRRPELIDARMTALQDQLQFEYQPSVNAYCDMFEYL